MWHTDVGSQNSKTYLYIDAGSRWSSATQNHKTMPKYVIYRGQVMSYEMYLLELAAK